MKFKVAGKAKSEKTFDWGIVYPHVIQMEKSRAGFGGAKTTDRDGKETVFGPTTGWVDIIDSGWLKVGRIYQTDDENVKAKPSKDGSFFFWSIRGSVTDVETGRSAEKKETGPASGPAPSPAMQQTLDAILATLIGIQEIMQKQAEGVPTSKELSRSFPPGDEDLGGDFTVPEGSEIPF